MSTGTLSSIISAIQSEQGAIAAVTGLPSDSQAIQSAAQPLLGGVIAQVQSAQGIAQGFAASAINTLNNVLTLVNDKSLDAARSAVGQLAVQASTAQAGVNQVVQSTQVALTQVTGWVQTLNTSVGNLGVQRSSLQSQIDSKSSDAASAKKKELLLIAAGPFGLVGLAVATAFYLKLQGEVDSLNRQKDDLASQLSSVTATQTAVTNLSSGLQTGVSTLLTLKSAMDFMASDVGNLIGDLDPARDPAASATVITVFSRTCLTEAATIQADAS
ncbi:MAG: hypothetical protein ABJE95_07750 [Byssovorax sp.]